MDRQDARDSPFLGDADTRSRILASVLTTAAAVAVALGTSLQIGYGAGVMNNLAPLTSASLVDPLEVWQWALIVSAFGFGGLLGAVLTNSAIGAIGHRAGLLVTSALVFVSSAILFLGTSWWVLFVGRILSGTVAGIGSGLVPIFLAELSTSASAQRAFGTVHQLSIRLGVFLPQLLTTPELQWLGTRARWRLVFLVPAFCTITQCVILPLIPTESREALIQRAMHAVGSGGAGPLGRSPESAYSVGELVGARKHRKQLLLCGGLLVSVQLCGVDVLLAYSSMVFRGARLAHPELTTATLSAVHVILAPVAPLLAGRFDRRYLLVHAWLAMGASYALSAFALVCSSLGVLPGFTHALTLISMVGVLAAFAAGPAGVVWLTALDLFPPYAKDAVVALGVASVWLANSATSLLFPVVHEQLGPASMLVFAASTFSFAYLTARFVPETRHRSLVDIGVDVAQRIPATPQRSESSSRSPSGDAQG